MHQNEYIEELKAHRFVWCPPGNGHDTHRMYEALQHGTVPVVMFHEGLADLHQKLPVLTVKRPEEVTLDQLRAIASILQPSLEQLWRQELDSVLTAAYWKKHVLSTISQMRYNEI